jgi:hypothetical protein
MTTGIGTITTSVPFASPDEGRRMPIPAYDGAAQPTFEDLDILDVMTLQSSAQDDALHRLGHIEPGTGTGHIQQANAVFVGPSDQITA